MSLKRGVACLPKKAQHYQWVDLIGIDIRLFHLGFEDISVHRQA